MAINLDPAQAAVPSSAERLDRHDAEARQDRWMLELERAMFSTNAKKLRGAIRQRDGESLAEENVLRPNGADAVSTITGHRFASAELGSPAGGRSAESPQAGPDSFGQGHDVHAARDSSARSEPMATGACDQRAMVAALPAHGRVRTPAAASVAAEWTAAVAPAAEIASGASASAATSISSAHLASVQTVQAGQRVMVPPASPPALGRSPESVPDKSTPAEFGPNTAEQADSGASTWADLAEFDKRLMHLFSGRNGMHAYIRDAQLDAAQIRSVAAALSTELALSGQSLTTLTVNGKRISLASKDVPEPALDADGAALVGSDELAGLRPHLQSLTLVRKEPSK